MDEKSEIKEFLNEIDKNIRSRNSVEIFYKTMRIVLMVSIGICGFLTAAASQSNQGQTFISQSGSLLTFGLISAISAVLNQALAPSEQTMFHKSVKKALCYIQGEVKYGDMPLAQAHKLKTIAVTNPESILGMLTKIVGDGKILTEPK
jgi:hypothetical protein